MQKSVLLVRYNTTGFLLAVFNSSFASLQRSPRGLHASHTLHILHTLLAILSCVLSTDEDYNKGQKTCTLEMLGR